MKKGISKDFPDSKLVPGQAQIHFVFVNVTLGFLNSK